MKRKLNKFKSRNTFESIDGNQNILKWMLLAGKKIILSLLILLVLINPSNRLLLPLFIIQDERKLNFKSIPQNLVAHVTARRFKEFLSEGAIMSPDEYLPDPTTHKNLAKLSLSGKNTARLTTASRRPSSSYSFKVGHRRNHSTSYVSI
jgi:hypothetical protein